MFSKGLSPKVVQSRECVVKTQIVTSILSFSQIFKSLLPEGQYNSVLFVMSKLVMTAYIFMSYLLDLKLCQKEVYIFSNVELIFSGVSHQIGIQHIIGSDKYSGHVTEKR